MTIIIDSNFIFALKFKKDKNSDRAIEILNELEVNSERLIITNYLVINEVITLVVARTKSNQYYLKNISDLIWGEEKFFYIIPFSPVEYLSIYEVLMKYCTSSRLLSFVDASLIYLYRKYNASHIISFDHHFDHITNRLF